MNNSCVCERIDCGANHGGSCIALSKAFHGDCPFYKEKKECERHRAETRAKLMSTKEGRLILSKYEAVSMAG